MEKLIFFYCTYFFFLEVVLEKYIQTDPKQHYFASIAINPK